MGRAHRWGCPFDARHCLLTIASNAGYALCQPPFFRPPDPRGLEPTGQIVRRAGGQALLVLVQPFQKIARGLTSARLGRSDDIERIGLFRLARDVAGPVGPDIMLADRARIA
jgi:hypothetical protein